MKLELKHITPYLPYDLMCREYASKIEKKDKVSSYVRGLLKTVDSFVIDTIYNGITETLDPEEIKLILRPLSDLTKEIEINGEKFIPICKLADGEYYTRSLRDDIANFQHLKNHITNLNRLYEWHFDVFGLIPEGLAIDINNI